MRETSSSIRSTIAVRAPSRIRSAATETRGAPSANRSPRVEAEGAAAAPLNGWRVRVRTVLRWVGDVAIAATCVVVIALFVAVAVIPLAVVWPDLRGLGLFIAISGRPTLEALAILAAVALGPVIYLWRQPRRTAIALLGLSTVIGAAGAFGFTKREASSELTFSTVTPGHTTTRVDDMSRGLQFLDDRRHRHGALVILSTESLPILAARRDIIRIDRRGIAKIFAEVAAFSWGDSSTTWASVDGYIFDERMAKEIARHGFAMDNDVRGSQFAERVGAALRGERPSIWPSGSDDDGEPRAARDVLSLLREESPTAGVSWLLSWAGTHCSKEEARAAAHRFIQSPDRSTRETAEHLINT